MMPQQVFSQALGDGGILLLSEDLLIVTTQTQLKLAR